VNCLYIVAHHPISPNYRGGGSAIYYEQLASLHALGCTVDLWHYATSATRQEFNDCIANDRNTYQNVRRMCRSIHVTTLPDVASWSERFQARVEDFLTGYRLENPFARTVLRRELRRRVATCRSDFIWAQHLGPAQTAVLQSQVPVIYSHHDWGYRVKALSAGKTQNLVRRRTEERVARSAASVVSGSYTECQELIGLGCRNVTYLPVAYEAATWDGNPPANSDVRIVHLGGLATTANRLGLERFFELVWGELGPARPELWIIGDTSAAGPKLRPCLRDAHCVGFVRDLRPVLRPFDLHIIPWEHDTGQRTRLPLVFSYGQVVVAVRASVAGLPEARDGENCRLVDKLEDMTSAIHALLRNPDERKRLGLAARRTFEQHFTRDALLPRYRTVLAQLSVAERTTTTRSVRHGEM
jgi:glycosyltransferase involved in cell wall biosynthesis